MTKAQKNYRRLAYFLWTVLIFFTFVNSEINAATPTSTPTITGISPQTAVAGQNAEMYGTNLVESVRLENLAGGAFYTVTASVNSDRTIASFEIPDLAGGIYKVSVSGSQGSVVSPQNLTIRSGGALFTSTTPPTVPTQGLLGFGQLVAMLFTWSLNILGIVVFVMIFYAGFKWFTAAGNTARVNEARAQITNAITGAIILLAAWIMLYTINPDLVGGTFKLPGVGTISPSGTQTTSSCPNPLTPPSGSPPNMASVVRQVASEFPQYLNESCQSGGGNWNFMDEVVKRLHDSDSKWGYNGKRGNVNNLSEDAISYYFGTGLPPQGSKDVYIVDIIGGHCGSNPQPNWIDQTPSTFLGCTTGAYVYPR